MLGDTARHEPNCSLRIAAERAAKGTIIVGMPICSCGLVPAKETAETILGHVAKDNLRLRAENAVLRGALQKILRHTGTHGAVYAEYQIPVAVLYEAWDVLKTAAPGAADG